MSNTTPTFFENARSYLRLLRQHIVKEDEILFEEAKEIGAGVHEKYCRIAQELERYAGLRDCVDRYSSLLWYPHAPIARDRGRSF